ncbi:hypothetical protein L0128_13025 [candidate division KSB1 bacterium]|nr:hypothetical protein [candidate division KSB1 bacterium]
MTLSQLAKKIDDRLAETTDGRCPSLEDKFLSKDKMIEKYVNYFKIHYKKFPPRPLSEDELKKFYYPQLAEGVMKPFLAKLELEPNEHIADKYLFTGHHGCGKSTELTNLAEQLKKNFTVLKFSALEIMDPRFADFKDLVLLIAIKLVEKLLDLNQAFDFEDTINALVNLWSEKAERGDKNQIQTSFSKLCKMMISQNSFRTTVRTKIEANLFHILEAISTMSDKITALSKNTPAAGTDQKKNENSAPVVSKPNPTGADPGPKNNAVKPKPVFLIIDDLDKLDQDPDSKQTIAFFKNNVKILTLPRCRIIYTMPFSLYYEDDFIFFRDAFEDCVVIPTVKIYNKENKEDPKQIEVFEKLIAKRMNIHRWFEEEILTDIIIRTGGLVSELMFLIRECCFQLTLKPKKVRKKIDADALKAVADRFKVERSRLLSKEERSILKKIYATKSIQGVPPNIRPLLLREGLVLEQHELNPWFDIHPLLRKALDLDEEPEFANF